MGTNSYITKITDISALIDMQRRIEQIGFNSSGISCELIDDIDPNTYITNNEPTLESLAIYHYITNLLKNDLSKMLGDVNQVHLQEYINIKQHQLRDLALMFPMLSSHERIGPKSHILYQLYYIIIDRII